MRTLTAEKIAGIYFSLGHLVENKQGDGFSMKCSKEFVIYIDKKDTNQVHQNMVM